MPKGTSEKGVQSKAPAPKKEPTSTSPKENLESNSTPPEATSKKTTESSPKTSSQDGEKVHLISIGLKNYKCIREAKIDIKGNITEIRGDAGQGKSTWLRGVESAIKGIDPDLVRKGADNAEILLVTDKATIERAIKPGSSDLKVTDVDGIKMTNAQAKQFLKTISAPEVFNVIEWVMLAEGPELGKTERLRKQRNMLLGAIPLSIGIEEMGLSPGMHKALSEVDLKGIDLGAHALVVVQQLGKAAEQHRRSKNALLDEVKRAATDARRPEIEPPGFPLNQCNEQARLAHEVYQSALVDLATQQRAEKQITDVQAQIAGFGDDIPSKGEIAARFSEIADRRDAGQKRIDEMNEQIAEEMAKIAAYNDEVHELIEIKSTRREITALEEIIEKQQELIDPKAQEKMEKKRDEAEATSAGRDARILADAHKAAQDKLKGMEDSVAPLDALVKHFRDELPNQLIERMEMPVEGMTIEDDVIKVGGIPLHQLGTSQMIPIGVSIASLLNPMCGFMLIDRAECLGSKDRVILAETARKEGLNLLLTIVDADAVPGKGVIVMEDGAPKEA